MTYTVYPYGGKFKFRQVGGTNAITVFNKANPGTFVSASGAGVFQIGDILRFTNISDVTFQSELNALSDANRTITNINTGTNTITIAGDTSGFTGTFSSGDASQQEVDFGPQNDFVLIGDITSGDVTVNLPLTPTLVNDGFFHEYYVSCAGAGTNVMRVNTASGEAFLLGYNEIDLKVGQTAHLGSTRNAGQWYTIKNINVSSQARRAAIWASTNFTAATATPFDTTDIQDNTEIIEHSTVSNPSRITAKTPGRHFVSYIVDIDSTGGGSWSCTVNVRKNGTTTIPGTGITFGNYQTEDTSASIPTIALDLVADDYLELVISQTGLTGNLRSAVFILDRDI